MEHVPPIIKIFGKLPVKDIGVIFKKHCTVETTLDDFLAMKDDI